MTITLYHSQLCPRCAQVRKHLAALLGDDYPAAVTPVEIIAHPVKTWQDGIRMIPALRAGDETLSGLLLSRDDIARFLEWHRGAGRSGAGERP